LRRVASGLMIEKVRVAAMAVRSPEENAWNWPQRLAATGSRGKGQLF